METKLLLQELKIHLIREKPLVVRTLRNNLFPVFRIEGEPIDLFCVYYTTPQGQWYLKLYPGSRRLQELEDQVTGVPSGDPHPYEDRAEELEVALLTHFRDHDRPFHNTIVVRVNQPCMKRIDGKLIIGKVAWQRIEGKAFSQPIYEPAANALELAPYAAAALKHSSYRGDYDYPETDVRHGLTDCPYTLVKYAQFVPQTGRMEIDEAMEQYPSGTRVRLLECRCEYFLGERRNGLIWVRAAARCESHDYTERTYGWLCSEQVEIVR